MALPPFSVLDLAPIVQGGTASLAFAHSLDLARHAEAWGYRRFWLAEHHNMPGIASAATAVAIGHVAAGTSTIRVGAGGIMLPNHAPLVIAEQFGTLEAMYPGRIDLGLGRAPGTDQLTARALRRDLASNADAFPEDVVELLAYFRDPSPSQRIQAFPGSGLHVPIWILGSSLFGAHVAGQLGLPYAFASHFSPDHLDEAIVSYRRSFRPSASLKKPYVMLGLTAVAAETDREAARLLTSIQQGFVALRRGAPTQLPPPVDSMDGLWSPAEKAQLEHVFAHGVVGSPATVKRGIEAFVERTKADEIIVATQVFDHAARLRSYEIIAQVTGLAARSATA